MERIFKKKKKKLGLTSWKFDHDKGRNLPENHYTRATSIYAGFNDAGKEASYGWGFTNSFNSEHIQVELRRGYHHLRLDALEMIQTSYMYITGRS